MEPTRRRPTTSRASRRCAPASPSTTSPRRTSPCSTARRGEGACGRGRTACRCVAVVGRPERRQVHAGQPHPRAAARPWSLDTPGVTRDRVSYPAEWSGHAFTLVDTGGWEADVAGLDARVAEQAEVAIELADVVLFVVDATRRGDRDRRAGGAPAAQGRQARGPGGQQGRRPARRGRRARRCGTWGWASRTRCRRCTGAAPVTCSTRVIDALPERLRAHGAAVPRAARAASRSSAGPTSASRRCSTRWRAAQRVVVDEVAGTTRDPVDELVELGGRPWWFVDTAGIRRRVHQTSGADFYASLRTQAAIEKAEVAVVLVDASAPLTEQDTRVISQVVEAGPGAGHRVQQVGPDGRGAPAATWSARSSRTSCRCSGRRGSTSRRAPGGTAPSSSPRWRRALDVVGHPHPDRPAQRVPRRARRRAPAPAARRQAAPHPVRDPGVDPAAAVRRSSPPGFLEAGYRRFIERRLRETFGFEGSPIEISVRVREKRKR